MGVSPKLVDDARWERRTRRKFTEKRAAPAAVSRRDRAAPVAPERGFISGSCRSPARGARRRGALKEIRIELSEDSRLDRAGARSGSGAWLSRRGARRCGLGVRPALPQLRGAV